MTDSKKDNKYFTREHKQYNYKAKIIIIIISKIPECLNASWHSEWFMCIISLNPYNHRVK